MQGLLRHEDLIYSFSFSPILSPKYFPIMPVVYDSPLVYTEDFLEEILANLESSIRDDVETIKKTLGIEELSFDSNVLNSLDASVNSSEKTINYGNGDSDINIIPQARMNIIQEFDLPLALRENWRTFSRSNERIDIPTWYTHTVDQSGDDIYLALRNFAILFNNMGLEKLKKIN